MSIFTFQLKSSQLLTPNYQLFSIFKHMIQEVASDLLQDLGVNPEDASVAFNTVVDGESRYIKDLRINLKNAFKAKNLSQKEAALIALSVAANEQNDILQKLFTAQAKTAEASEAEIAEAVACASLLAANNVFYRFRHFMNKDKYNTIPAGIKMQIMMKPVSGKEFFELMSLAISAVNGCEMCVTAHEKSLLELGATEERVFDAVRIASVVVSATKLIY
ncbi:alkylhydroperoxidase AhpD family core domain protein [Microscilla marina ATCC 23134]|uniref:Alkyl hydroperoxide reductase AhpD n=2 Tax=Microscilla marina TaxID=1027 RepID=A1ZPY2_MICM2|nr:alkylhydroperoxidase AhpD family core domain protein [Microscilla marina ATCC 23134]